MITVRKASEKNLDEIKQLYDKINEYLETHVNYPGWIKGVYPNEETAVEGWKENTLFVAVMEDKIVGSVILNHLQEDAYKEILWKNPYAEEQVLVVHTLVVHPSYLHKGVGRKLMDFAKEYGRANNLKAIRLDVSENNPPAIFLYESCGFQRTGTVDLRLPYKHLKWFHLYEYCLEQKINEGVL